MDMRVTRCHDTDRFDQSQLSNPRYESATKGNLLPDVTARDNNKIQLRTIEKCYIEWS